MRAELIDRQLRAHLPTGAGTAVDLGCGDGEQGLRLARRGWTVTLLDASDAALERVRRRLGTEAPEVRGRVRLVHARAEQARQRLEPERFGLVCCHALMPFVDDARTSMGVVAALARPAAVVSIAFKNADAIAMRAGLRGRFGEATHLLQGRPERAQDGTVLAAHTLDEVLAAAAAAGIEVETWYGVQTFTAHRQEPADDSTVGAAVILEELAGVRDPYRSLARQLHVVGNRSSAPGEGT